jgi:hemoglobin/transferrin/lactoferrin receptor protein
MKKYILALLLIVNGLVAISQVITVLDSDTKQPLEMVTLMSEHPRSFVTTNVLGQADISPLKGSQRIEIRMLGHKTETRTYPDLLNEKIIHLKPSVVNMDAVIVSATRWSQKSGDVPTRILSISSAQVALHNPQTTADLLVISGGVFIQKSQQGGGSPMIRGFATNRLLYSVDGVRMNTAIFRSGNIQNIISLDPFAIEQTEVLFGPGAVIYGSDAIGGVMSFQTLTPQLSFSGKPLVKGKVVSRWSTANHEQTGHVDVNLGWKNFAMITSISANDFGDLRMGSHGPDEYLRPFYVQRIGDTDQIITNEDPQVQKPTAYSQMNIMQKFRFIPHQNWDLQYGFHWSETSSFSRYDRHIRYKDGLPRYGEWSYGPQKWMMNHFSITHHAQKGWYSEMSVRLAQQTFEESRIDRNINKAERHIRSEKVDALSGNLDFSKSISQNHQLFYGLEWVRNDVQSTGIDEDILTGIKVEGPSRYPQAIWESMGAYLNFQYRINEKLSFIPGLRYSRFIMDADFDTLFYPFPFTNASLDNGSVTGNLGMVYRPDDMWVINGGLSSGFRSPNVDDIGKVFDSAPGIVVVPNPDLEAEYVWNVEMGITHIFNDRLKVDLTGFFTILDNALVRRDFLLDGKDSIYYDGTLSRVQAVQNAAQAQVYGIQAGIELKLPMGFGLMSDFNYQKGEEELDDGTTSPSRHAAPWYGNTRLTWTNGALRMQFYSEYSGEKRNEDLPEEEKSKTEIYAVDKNGNPWSPGWITVNYQLSYKFTSGFMLAAGLENITDLRYKTYSSGIVAPGRNFVLSARFDF